MIMNYVPDEALYKQVLWIIQKHVVRTFRSGIKPMLRYPMVLQSVSVLIFFPSESMKRDEESLSYTILLAFIQDAFSLHKQTKVFSISAVAVRQIVSPVFPPLLYFILQSPNYLCYFCFAKNWREEKGDVSNTSLQTTYAISVFPRTGEKNKETSQTPLFKIPRISALTRTGEKKKETSQTPLFKIPGISALPRTGEENRERS